MWQQKRPRVAAKERSIPPSVALLHSSKRDLVWQKRDLVRQPKRPSVPAKGTQCSSKRDLVCQQKRPSVEAKEA